MSGYKRLIELGIENDIMFYSLAIMAFVALIGVIVAVAKLNLFRVHLERRNQILKDRFGTTEDFY